MTNITTLRPGEHFMFKGFEWVCLDPNHPIPHYDSWIWTATPWYCGDKDSDTGTTCFVRVVNTYGQLNGSYADRSGAIVQACVLNPKSLNLRQNMAYVEEVAE